MFTALKFRNFRLLYLGQTTSSIGNSLFRLTLFWLVASMTNSPAYLSWLGFAMTLPAILSVFNGVFVDRFERRRLMILCDVIRFVIVAVLTFVAMREDVSPLVYIISFAVLAYFGNLFENSFYAVYPKTVDESGMTSATGLVQANFELSNIVSALIGGILIATLGAVGIFGFNAATFLISLLSLWAVRLIATPKAEPEAPEPAAPKPSFWQQMKEGFVYIGKLKVMRRIFPAIILCNLAFPPFFTLTASWSIDVLNAGVQGFMMLELGMGVGILAGSLLAGTLIKRWSEKSVLIASILLSVTLVIFPATDMLSISILSLTVFGVAYGVFNTLIFTFLQMIVPDHLRGRTFGTVFTLAGMSFPIGNALAAFLLPVVGLKLLFWIATAGMVLSFFWMLPFIMKEWGSEQPQAAVETSPTS